MNSSNVNPFIADWAETDNTEQIPGAKLALGALELGAFQQTDIDDIPPGGSQSFDYGATVQKDMDGTLAYIGGGWNKAAAGGGGGGTDKAWYWAAHVPGGAWVAGAARTALYRPFPVGGYADYAALRAAILDGTIPQIAVRISQNDVGDIDDDHGTSVHPNISGFYQSSGTWRVFPGHALNVNPVGFTISFGAANLTIASDAAIAGSDTVVVRVAIWA